MKARLNILNVNTSLMELCHSKNAPLDKSYTRGVPPPIPEIEELFRRIVAFSMITLPTTPQIGWNIDLSLFDFAVPMPEWIRDYFTALDTPYIIKSIGIMHDSIVLTLELQK